MNVPFIDLKAQYQSIKPQIQDRINAVLDHGQYIMGPEVNELENRLSKLTGANYCITCASGTEALLISLMALGIKQGDEVITTSFSFVATAEVIVLLGAKPVYVDINYETCNIDVNKINAAISSRTKAIIAVSLYGQTAEMDVINEIAKKNGNIQVIEDAAQSFGAEYKGKKSCNLSDIGCTSFFPSKPLGCYGDGGAIFTNNLNIAKACREIRVHGQSQRYIHNRIGLCGRMDTIQCAILLAKLENFSWEIEQRQIIGQRYNQLMDDMGIERVKLREGCKSVYAQYTIKTKERDELQNFLHKAGVPTVVHYPLPINEQKAYQENNYSNKTPIASRVSKEVLSLPMSAYLKECEQMKIVTALKSYKNNNRKKL